MQEIITPSQVAALLQIHVKTVYRLAEQGIIPGSRIGRRWRFSRTDILALVSNGTKTTSVASSLARSSPDKTAPADTGARADGQTPDNGSGAAIDVDG